MYLMYRVIVFGKDVKKLKFIWCETLSSNTLITGNNWIIDKIIIKWTIFN